MTNQKFSAARINVHRDFVVVTGKNGDEIRYDLDTCNVTIYPCARGL